MGSRGSSSIFLLFASRRLTFGTTQALRVSPAQSFQAFSFSLASASTSAEALAAAAASHNEFPDAVFCCAGASKPMFLMEMSEAELGGGMRDGYWVQAWTAWVSRHHLSLLLLCLQSHSGSCKGDGKTRTQGENYTRFFDPWTHVICGIFFVLSCQACFTRYACLCPRVVDVMLIYPGTVALAECLRSEGLLYGITTHIFFPPTMYTPGFDEENKTKPAITRKIESTDEGLTAEQAAQGLFKGVENGEFHITADLITSLFKASTRGSSPRGNALFEIVLDIAAWVCLHSRLTRLSVGG